MGFIMMYKGFSISDYEMHYYPVINKRIPKLVIASEDEESPLLFANSIEEAKEIIDQNLE